MHVVHSYHFHWNDTSYQPCHLDSQDMGVQVSIHYVKPEMIIVYDYFVYAFYREI